MSRRLAVSQWQSGTADRHSELSRGISPNKPDFPAVIPRQIHLQQSVHTDSLLDWSAAYLRTRVSTRGIDTVGHYDRPWHHSSHVRNKFGGLIISSTVFQRFTGWCGCRSTNGDDKVFSCMSFFTVYQQEIQLKNRQPSSIVSFRIRVL